MRNYIPNWIDIGVSKDRYLELLHFCRQYPEWLRKPGNADRILLVEECAKRIDGGRWYMAIMEHVCYKLALSKIEPAHLPTAHRWDFYRAKKDFFRALNEETERRRGNHDGEGIPGSGGRQQIGTVEPDEISGALSVLSDAPGGGHSRA